MTKVRLYHLAADWDIPAQTMLEALHEAGRRLKSHYVEVDATEVDDVRAILQDAGLFGGPPPDEELEEEPEQEPEAAPETPAAPEAPAPAPEVAAPAPTPEPAPVAEAPVPEAPVAVAEAPAPAPAPAAAVEPAKDGGQAAPETAPAAEAKPEAKPAETKPETKAVEPAPAPAAASAPAPAPAPAPTPAPAPAPRPTPPATRPGATGTPGDPLRPAGVAKGFTGFAPGFDPNARRSVRGGGGPTGGLGRGGPGRPGLGGRPGGPGMAGRPGAPGDATTADGRPARDRERERERDRERAARAGGPPTGEEDSGDDRRRRPGVSRTAVSPTKRPGAPGGAAGRPATRRAGGQAQLGRGRRMERLMQEREHWYKATRGKRGGKRALSSVNVARPDQIEIELPISLKDLSAELAIRVSELTALLMKEGMMINLNQPVPKEAIELIGVHYEIDVTVVDEKDIEREILGDFFEEGEGEEEAAVADDGLEPRQPVVTVLGHVDHGKTSLLDRIRKAKAPVAPGEAGGITQHIGAYVAHHQGKPITFIDTPGHEAFTEMRVRGANITDIVMLVIAADDGVMPQTKEAIQHAQAADARIIVALNKSDKPGANRPRVLQQLTSIEGMLPTEFGGTVDVVSCSAISGEGIDELLEHILFETEAMNLRANPSKQAVGTVLEAQKSQGRGIVATILVQDGTLQKGDLLLAGRSSGRVRSMFDENGKVVKEAGPGTPVEVLGLDEVPNAGDRFHVVEKEADLRAILDKRQADQRRSMAGSSVPTDEAGVWQRLADKEIKEVRIVLKADTQGTLQVLKNEIGKLGTEEVRCRIIRDGVGQITTADINLAIAERTGQVAVIGFGVNADSNARSLAREHGIEIRTHRVIYELLKEIKDVMAGALEPEERENVLGQVEVRKVFKSSKLGNICGCFVEQGIVRRNAMVRLIRDGIVLWQGELSSLRRFKDDVSEVRENFECGIKLRNYDDVKDGDRLEVFEIQKIARTLD